MSTNAVRDRLEIQAELKKRVEGDIRFDKVSRLLYSTDASIYQIEPIGVVVPRHSQDVVRVVQIAGDEGVPLLARGGGTSQCGQTVGEALVIDVSKHLNGIVDFDPDNEGITVQPGLALDQLNGFIALRPLDSWVERFCAAVEMARKHA